MPKETTANATRIRTSPRPSQPLPAPAYSGDAPHDWSCSRHHALSC